MKEQLQTKVIGHVLITDDQDNVLLDQHNAIHPQNISRILSKAISGEQNGIIYRIAFGNGGTEVDSAYTVTYRTPNIDTWDTRLYRETFSKVVDSNSIFYGTDPGSADSQTGVRPGGGAIPGDPENNSVTSIEPDSSIISQVEVRCLLSVNEPKGQIDSDYTPPTSDTETDFTFDEIGLYSPGLQPIATNGYQMIDIGDRQATDSTGLSHGVKYAFDISVDGANTGVVDFIIPEGAGTGVNGEITFGDVCEALNTRNTDWQIQGAVNLTGSKIIVTDNSNGSYPSIVGSQTYGMLRFDSETSGVSSSVDISGPNTSAFAASLRPQGILLDPIAGSQAGDRNNTSNPTLERERLLSHIIFSPITKTGNRTLSIKYTITIAVTGVER